MMFKVVMHEEFLMKKIVFLYSMDGSRKGAKSTIYYTVEYSLSLYVAQSTVLFFHSVASVLYHVRAPPGAFKLVENAITFCSSYRTSSGCREIPVSPLSGSGVAPIELTRDPGTGILL